MLKESSSENRPLHIEGVQTPKIQTNRAGSKLHKEAHRSAEIETNEEIIEQTREEILSHYNIAIENTTTQPTASGTKREMCVFTILTNKEDPKKTFYADGHTAHAILLDKIFGEFPDVGVEDRLNIPNDFFDTWEIKKGFIDPYGNGFKNFEDIHSALANMVVRNGETNELSESEKIEIQSNPNAELPNWFRSDK